MKTYRWAKLWIDMLDDWKVGTLPDSSYRRFIECLLLAKEYNAGGVLPPVIEMAYRLRIGPDTLTADLMRLAQNELVELTDYNGEERWWLPNFEKRQETPMTSTERVQAFRERERIETLRGDNETPMKRRVSQEGEEEEEKKEKESRTRPRATAPKQPAQPPPRPSPPPAKELTPEKEAHAHMINALGEVCGMSPYLNFDKLSDPAAQLIEAGYTEEQVRTHYARPDGWWYQRDWRGQKGEYPRPAQVIETIYGAIEQSRPAQNEGGKLWLDRAKVFD